MITQTYNLEFLTPCFCAGADQAMAEIRPASIRGKLRWWVRVLGSRPEQEAELFGAVRGENTRSSSLILRALPHPVASKWQPVSFSGVSNTGYLMYFAKAASQGSRFTSTGALPVGSGFRLLLSWRRNPSPDSRSLFDLALDCFLTLGSFGLRSSRGLGSFECKEQPFSEEAFNRLLLRVKTRSPGFLAGLAGFNGPESKILDALGAQLRALRQGYSAGAPQHSNPTPLGSSRNPRQTSAVYLRPVRAADNQYRLVVFEAPALKVLGVASRTGAPRLKNGIPACL